MAEDQSLLIGRLQAGLAGLERIVESLHGAISELRGAMADERRAIEQRVIALELQNKQDDAREQGHAAGFSNGKKIGAAAIILAALLGVKTGAVGLWELVMEIIK
jgi:hypothetical protein